MCITFEWEFSQFIPFDWIVKRGHLLEILYHQSGGIITGICQPSSRAKGCKCCRIFQSQGRLKSFDQSSIKPKLCQQSGGIITCICQPSS